MRVGFASLEGIEEQFGVAVEQTHGLGRLRSPRCAVAKHGFSQRDQAKRLECKICGHKTSLTTGTMVEEAKMTLTIWLPAIYLISQANTWLSATALMRPLADKYAPAWRSEPRLMVAMCQWEQRYVRHDSAQIDNAYPGGVHRRGKAGRGPENQVPFGAAVSFNERTQMVGVKLSLVAGFVFRGLWVWSRQNQAPVCPVYSDGLFCFNGLTTVGCADRRAVFGGRKLLELPEFQWITSELGNLKTSLSGAYLTFASSKYAGPYLTAFACRFNRRSDLATLPQHLQIGVGHCGWHPGHELRLSKDLRH